MYPLYILDNNKLKKRITFPKPKVNEIKKDDFLYISKDFMKCYMTEKYYLFVNMILFIIGNNINYFNKKNNRIYLKDLLNKEDINKYFKMCHLEKKDYEFWEYYGLVPPLVKISEMLPKKIVVKYMLPTSSVNNVYFEAIM